jgi:hypothetical protein
MFAFCTNLNTKYNYKIAFNTLDSKNFFSIFLCSLQFSEIQIANLLFYHQTTRFVS